MPTDPELDRWLDAILAAVDADYRARLAGAPPVIQRLAAELTWEDEERADG